MKNGDRNTSRRSPAALLETQPTCIDSANIPPIKTALRREIARLARLNTSRRLSTRFAGSACSGLLAAGKESIH